MSKSESASFSDEVTVLQNCDTGFGRIKSLKLRKKKHPDKPVPKVYQENYKGGEKKEQKNKS